MATGHALYFKAPVPFLDLPTLPSSLSGRVIHSQDMIELYLSREHTGDRWAAAVIGVKKYQAYVMVGFSSRAEMLSQLSWVRHVGTDG